MSTAFHVPVFFDYLATFSWALSGAIVALRKRLDVVGVFVLALLTSVGGSILRDGVFLQRTPPVLTDPVYLPLITLATLLIGLLRQRIADLKVVDKLVSTIDAIGTPAFAVVGMQLALGAGIPLPGVVLVGAVSGVGGGVLRDMIVREIPFILQPGQFFSVVVVLACLVFLLLTLALDVATLPAAWTTIALFFMIRSLTIRYNWQTRPVLREPGA
ncbi:TRIC cation channel family protein [Zoogloea sp.]|uniref:trimeric intracellular cation channel family protein n=1 Tax=Zoogloea sp. TaxID=49181 RepID=UPI00262D4EB6|nr:TRIC cation channel family protein [Zoogloea sp.]MDD3352184.1 TRIC cation channel family protein [Zoogloea sp.]